MCADRVKNIKRPSKMGLYDPQFEKDSCGVGLVANIKGIPSREIMEDAYIINSRMDHRGGCGFEENTGDGAGILMALPDKFFQEEAKKLNFVLPKKDFYAVGNMFLPQQKKYRQKCKTLIEQVLKTEKLKFIGWREVPIDADKADVGPASRDAQPFIEQLFVGASRNQSPEDFEKMLFLARKKFTHQIKSNDEIKQNEMFFACSLSSKVITYKGMLTPAQLFPFYPDLMHKDYQTHLAMVHSRFSTNTFPSWDRAQPNRFMCHNGEINTLKGNMNAMKARQGVAESEIYVKKLKQ